MKLKDLTYKLDGLQIHGSAETEILGMTLDSRAVQPGWLFAAIKGTQMDGHRFIPGAIEKGARTIFCTDLPDDCQEGISYIQGQNGRDDIALLAAAYYGNPSKQLKLVGITGTNGKTSIASWLYQLTQNLGYPAGLISTIQVLIDNRVIHATHTTPDPISLQKYLHEMVVAGCSYAFMEVSSHALDQRRTHGISFAGAVFTNLSQDHLDYHQTFAEYIRAKKRLFDDLDPEAFALSNADDKNGSVMLQNCAALKKRFSIRSYADFTIKVQEQHPEGMALLLENQEIWVPVLGTYNASNLLAVYATAVLLGFEKEEVLQALSSLTPVEGRLETVALGGSITAIVDYAHTPDALDNVLRSLQGVVGENNQIITVVGAGGDRDKGKRPKMTQAALSGSHRVILTSDNPRTEDPETILDDMEAGMADADQTRVLRITDRRAAIKTAVALAQSGDIILVAGKGHENYQEINGVKHHFDDVEELEKLKKEN